MAVDYKNDYDSMVNKGMRKELNMDVHGKYQYDPQTKDLKKVNSYMDIIRTNPHANAATRALGDKTRKGVIRDIFKAGYAQQAAQNPITQYNQDRHLVKQQQGIDQSEREFNQHMAQMKDWDYKNDDNLRGAMNTMAMATTKDQLGPEAPKSSYNLNSEENKKIFSDAQKMQFGGSGGSSAAPAVDSF